MMDGSAVPSVARGVGVRGGDVEDRIEGSVGVAPVGGFLENVAIARICRCVSAMGYFFLYLLGSLAWSEESGVAAGLLIEVNAGS